MDLMEPQRFKWIVSGIDFNKLTKWEEDFIESCEKQLQFKRHLSMKQTEILEKIYSEKWK